MKCSLGLFTFLVIVYAAVFAAFEFATSPTDRLVRLSDGHEMAYLAAHEPTDPAGRVVLVHGAPADASSWDRLIRSQSQILGDAEIYSVDRLGYGNSSTGAELTLAGHAQSLEPLISEGAILVGHSYGGPVVLRAAAEFPERVGGIILVAGACDPFMNDSVWARKAGVAVAPLLPESWDVANRELLALTDENQAMQTLMGRVTCQVVVIHGAWDPVCPHEGTVSYLRDNLKNAKQVRVVSLKRTGHNIHLSNPEVIGTEIRTLLDAQQSIDPIHEVDDTIAAAN